MPGADGPITNATICLYTNTPDGDFLIDTHPGAPGLAYASACSGHGFKFAPVIGEALADLALTGRSSLRDVIAFPKNSRAISPWNT